MRKHLRSTAIAAVALACLAATGCGNSKAAEGRGGDREDGGAFTVDASACPDDASQEIPDGEPVKVGMSMALSGPLAAIGAPNVDGFKAAIAAANADGGVDGHKIELVLKDDAYDAARATTNAQAFVGKDKVDATILQVSDASIQATQPIYEQACVPQLGAITAHAGASDPDEHGWTTVAIPPAEGEVNAAVAYLEKEVAGGTVMEIRQQSTIGEDWGESFPGKAEDAGLTVADVQEVAPTATNLDGQAAKVTAAGVDAVMAEMSGAQCAPLLQSLSKAGFDGVVVLTTACNGAKQNMAPVGDYADGVAALFFQKDPSVAGAESDPGLKQYFSDVEKYEPNADPTITMTLNGYSAGELFVQNLRDAAQMEGGLNRVNIMNAAWTVEITRPEFVQPEQAMDGDKDPYIINDVAAMTYDLEGNTWKDTGIRTTYEAAE